MMNLFIKLQNMVRSEKGQGMVEYGLIIGLVAVVLVGALTLLAGKDGSGGLGKIFATITTSLSGN